MCRVLAYIGPETPLENLLLEPENSLINQALDPEGHPELQLAGWGFGAWGENLLKPEKPFIYRRPMAAFYDDNTENIIPSLQASTMLAHVRAASYNADVVMVDENCHPFHFKGSPWLVAQNGFLPGWQVLQKELLQHCKVEYLKQMKGNTDTEFIFVLLLSLLEGDSNEEIQRAFEKLLGLIAKAMKDLDMPGLTKLKMGLVAPGRIVGINWGLGHEGEVNPDGDWKQLRKSDPKSDDYSLSMLLEPMYLLMGGNPEGDGTSAYDLDSQPEGEASAAIFASEPLTEDTDAWLNINYGEIVFLENTGDHITKTVSSLSL